MFIKIKKFTKKSLSRILNDEKTKYIITIKSSYEIGGSKENISYTYGLFNVDGLYVRSCIDDYLIYVGGNQKTRTKGIMPIVYLDKNIQLEETGNQVNSCTEWKINE